MTPPTPITAGSLHELLASISDDIDVFVMDDLGTERRAHLVDPNTPGPEAKPCVRIQLDGSGFVVDGSVREVKRYLEHVAPDAPVIVRGFDNTEGQAMFAKLDWYGLAGDMMQCVRITRETPLSTLTFEPMAP